jgi:hypothetical protein
MVITTIITRIAGVAGLEYVLERETEGFTLQNISVLSDTEVLAVDS